MIDFQELLNEGLKQLFFYCPKLIVAVLTLVIGLWIINRLVKLVFKKIPESKMDISLKHFLKSIVVIGLKIMLWITVISMLGIKMTSFVAIFGAARLAVGLALQGSLANFAGGVLIMLFRPYKVGDYIEAQGHAGTVHIIQIFNTTLKTPDNKTIVIPNGNLSNSSLVNYSTEPKRRVDLTFGIGYGDDIKKAKEIMLGLINADNRILKDPVPQVAVSDLGDSSVNFVFRVWVNSTDYWNVNFDMKELVKMEFDKNDISIPYPQTDVHLYKHE